MLVLSIRKVFSQGQECLISVLGKFVLGVRNDQLRVRNVFFSALRMFVHRVRNVQVCLSSRLGTLVLRLGILSTGLGMFLSSPQGQKCFSSVKGIFFPRRQECFSSALGMFVHRVKNVCPQGQECLSYGLGMFVLRVRNVCPQGKECLSSGLKMFVLCVRNVYPQGQE